MRSRVLSLLNLAALMLTFVPTAPALGAGPDKAGIYAEMLSLAAQIEQLKPLVGEDAAAASAYAAAEARYRNLSAALGGDDPGRLGISGPAGSPDSVAVAPPAPAFCNATTAAFSDNTPVAIPTGPATVTSTILVSGAGTYLFDVDVTTFIQHTFAADLDVTIQSPLGTVVTLTSDNGAGNDDIFNGTVWDDDANPAGQVPYTTNNGMVTDHAYVNLTLASPLVPEEALAAFIGEDPNGTWTLTISDDLAGDGGSLNSWGLDLTTLDQDPSTASTVASDNTPVAIPTGPGVATSAILVAGAGTYLFDVEVTTFIQHTFAADLDVTIQSPAGTVVTLTSDNGAGNDNVFNGTVWDDDANPAGQVPYTTNNGMVTDHAYVNLTLASPLVPEEALGAFIGEDPNGTWTITVSDDLAGDGGSLDSWSLEIVTATCTPPDADLAISKTSNAAGPVSVGDAVVFTLGVENLGPGAATGVTVTDTIPAGLTYVSNDCGASYIAPTLTWAIGNLPNAAITLCNVTVTVAAAGAFVNTATVTADQADPVTANNAASATVTALQSVLEIPTLDGIGLAALALLLAGFAFASLRRRRA
jgi:uncharacterized repeat protein (TIGR01451 family)